MLSEPRSSEERKQTRWGFSSHDTKITAGLASLVADLQTRELMLRRVPPEL
jgi:hypothetical protein